jgi:hypothetical protein
MENQATIRTHKRIGIASFLIGMTCVILIMALFGTAAGMAKAGRITAELKMMMGLGIIAVCFASPIGVVLGLFGAADRLSKKVYPVLGLSLNIVVMFLFVALVVIGLSMGTA